MNHTEPLAPMSVRAAVAGLAARGARTVTVAQVAALRPELTLETVANRLRSLAAGFAPPIPGVSVIPAPEWGAYELVVSPPMTAARVAASIAPPAIRPVIPRDAFPVDPETRSRIRTTLGRAAASIAGAFPPSAPPARPKWHRRFGGYVDLRDWTVGIVVSEAAVHLSPVPCVTITYRRACR